MRTIFIQELKMNIKSLLYWLLGMVLLIAVAIAEYSTVVGGDGAQSMMPMLMAMPKIVRVMFNMNAISIDTPLGYFACMFLWYEFVAYAHAAFLGASIVAKEERDRTADYIFTKPYSRSTVMSAKVLVCLVSMVVLNIVTWTSSAVAFGHPKGFDPIQREIAFLMLGMLLVQVIFFALGLLLSAVTRTQKSASSFVLLAVLAGYAAGVAVEYAEKSSVWDYLTPFRYFYAAGVAEDGMRISCIGLSLVLCVIFMIAAYLIYNRRDLQV